MATKIIYLVVHSDYDIYDIQGSYELREHAEAHVKLSKEINPKFFYLDIEELEVTDEPPRVVYSADYSAGVRSPGGRFVGQVAPAHFIVSETTAGDRIYAVAWGYSQEEADSTLDALLLEKGVS